MAVMPILSLRIRPEVLARVTRDLAGIKDGPRTAISSAINDTLKRARTRLTKVISERINLKQKDIRDSITIAKSTKATLMGTLWIKGKRKPLGAFSARWRRSQAGATYMISKEEGRKMLPGSFVRNVVASTTKAEFKMSNKQRIMQQVLSGEGDSISEHKAVFMRKGKKRLPITQKYGLSAVGAFEKAPGLSAMEMETLELDLETRIKSKIDWLISKDSKVPAAMAGYIGPEEPSGGAAA